MFQLSAYDLLLQLHSNYGPVFLLFPTARYWPKIVKFVFSAPARLSRIHACQNFTKLFSTVKINIAPHHCCDKRE